MTEENTSQVVSSVAGRYAGMGAQGIYDLMRNATDESRWEASVELASLAASALTQAPSRAPPSPVGLELDPVTLFGTWLTTRDKVIQVGAAAEVYGMWDALEEWQKRDPLPEPQAVRPGAATTADRPVPLLLQGLMRPVALILKWYSHRKRPGKHLLLVQAKVQASTRPIVEGDVVVVYVDTRADAYARLHEEFHDGRFEPTDGPR